MIPISELRAIHRLMPNDTLRLSGLTPSLAVQLERTRETRSYGYESPEFVQSELTSLTLKSGLWCNMQARA